MRRLYRTFVVFPLLLALVAPLAGCSNQDSDFNTWSVDKMRLISDDMGEVQDYMTPSLASALSILQQQKAVAAADKLTQDCKDAIAECDTFKLSKDMEDFRGNYRLALTTFGAAGRTLSVGLTNRDAAKVTQAGALIGEGTSYLKLARLPP
jgi:hypothetical protein